MRDDNTFRFRCALIVAGAALTLRLAYCFLLISRSSLSDPKGDFFQLTDGYIDLAVNWVEHHRFAFLPEASPTTYRAPLYPAALAVGYFFDRDIISATLWVNCIASALTCVLVYALVAPFLREQVHCLALAAVVAYPLSLYYCASSYSDTFITFTIVLYLWSLVRLVKQPTLANGVLNGLSFGATVLTKSVTILFPLLLIPFLVWKARNCIVPVMLAVVVGVLPVAAWTARNFAVTHRFVLVCGGAGYNMLLGNYMIDRGDDPGDSFHYGEDQSIARLNRELGLSLTRESLRTGPHLDIPPDLDRAFGVSARRMILDDPSILVRKVAINFWRFWTFSTTRAKYLLNALVHFTILGLAGVLLCRWARAGRLDVAVMMLFMAYIVGTYVLVVCTVRFCLPVVLVLAPFAALTVIDAIEELRGKAVEGSVT